MLHHQYCRMTDCRLCLADHEALEKALDELTGDNTVDHLGRMHRWMKLKGREAETEWGWATPQTFEEKNIEEYVQDYKAGKI